MKKRSSWPYAVLATGIVAAGVLGCQSQSSNSVPEGAVTVTAEATGFNQEQPVVVEVTATEDTIYSVTVTSHGETDGIGTNAIDQMPDEMVSQNRIDVDGVTGATLTSTALRAAVSDALNQAGFDISKFGGELAEEVADVDMTIPEGVETATASAMGNNGDVTVEVAADADRIYSVVVTDHMETEGIGDMAIAQLPGKIVSGNTIRVDAVSGATVTSGAIIEATKLALTELGLDADSFDRDSEAVVEQAEDETLEADIVIVGAGGAGMTAAIESADAGKTVILVESQSMVGGNSVRATGGMNAGDTDWQDANEFAEDAGITATFNNASTTYADNADIQALLEVVQAQYEEYQASPDGYFDSVELMELDTMIGGRGLNDIDLVKTLAENTAPAIDWLDSIGAELHNVAAFGGASVKRIHRPVNEQGQTTAVGAYMVPILRENVESRENITLLLSTEAKEILVDDNGAAVGIVATGETGNTVTVNAQAVILTTGGFGANLEMVESYKPELAGFMSTNANGAQGTGITMAEAVGAGTVDLEQIQIHPTVEANTAHLITEGLRGDGAILVNADGVRFTNEVGTRDVVSAAEIAQPGGYAYLIIDQEMVDTSAVIQGYINSGYTVSGDTPEELAEALEIDPEAFSATMTAWNGYVEAEEDPEFNRVSFSSTLEDTLYAIKVTPGIHHTMGGLKIDSDAQVLTEDGEVIAGLYAAGEVTGGVHGANRLGGNAVADFTVFGRIAGQSAAASVE